MENTYLKFMILNYQPPTYVLTGEKNMNIDAVSQFKSELNSFFVLVLLNMAFGALTMAFGMQFIVSSVLRAAGMADGDGNPGSRRDALIGMFRDRVCVGACQCKGPERDNCRSQGI